MNKVLVVVFVAAMLFIAGCGETTTSGDDLAEDVADDVADPTTDEATDDDSDTSDDEATDRDQQSSL